MRIGIEAQRIFRTAKHGMDIVALETIRHLAAQYPEHTFVAFVRPGDDPCLAARPNLEVQTLPAASYPTWEQGALPRAVRAADVDLLHCTSNTAPLRLGVPLVLTLHDVIFMEGPALWRRGGTWYQRLGTLYRRWLVPALMQRTAALATVSTYERNRIAARFPSLTGRVHVVPNGVDTRFAPVTSTRARHATRQRYDLPDRYLLFLGNTDPKKNLRGVLRAYATYVEAAADPLSLVIADYAPHRLQTDLAALDVSGTLARHIHLPGYIRHTDLPAVYSMAALFLYPSLRESFGMPILEAMACGTPVITADAAAMPETAGDAAVLVDPTRPADLAQRIAMLLRRPRRRRALVKRGYRRAERFTWSHSAQTLMGIYEQVLAARPSVHVAA